MKDGEAPRTLHGADWLVRPRSRAVFEALSAEGHGVRAVGGAVRDALLGRAVKDVDLATTAWPQDVLRLAQAAGLKVVPTGIEHGTVMVVSDGAPYEVTTLRRDVETFGRRARVTFTSDWAEDARRRDFSMNALYCDPEGTLFDPVGGYPDLVARRVRFIGDPAARIREDYLRIPRFFRLSADHGEGALDSAGLAACAALRDGLASLSGERIRAELFRLLVAPYAAGVVTAMVEHRILDVLFPLTALRAFARLVDIERALNRSPDALARLAALIENGAVDVGRVAERLRLTNRETERLTRMFEGVAMSAPPQEQSGKARLYALGPTAYVDALLLGWARSNEPIDDPGWRHALALPEHWRPPAMPFTGADVLALGVPSGPEVGRILAEFETWWIAEDFPKDRRLLRAKLAEIAARRPRQ